MQEVMLIFFYQTQQWKQSISLTTLFYPFNCFATLNTVHCSGRHFTKYWEGVGKVVNSPRHFVAANFSPCRLGLRTYEKIPFKTCSFNLLVQLNLTKRKIAMSKVTSALWVKPKRMVNVRTKKAYRRGFRRILKVSSSISLRTDSSKTKEENKQKINKKC